MDVHNEVKTVLQLSCIPHVAGATWAEKIVKRMYAFDDPSIPREETQYFKVVYDAKYPVPPQEVCSKGGKYIQRVLGAGASTLENFIVKRKLMGPCWIRIRNPVASGAVASWCKLELQVDNPKNITRLDLVETGTICPPPPIVTMTLKLKTIVNPKTHKSEIVSLSALSQASHVGQCVRRGDLAHDATVIDSAFWEHWSFRQEQRDASVSPRH